MMQTVDDDADSTGKEGKINEEECITKPESDRDSLLPTPVALTSDSGLLDSWQK